MRKPHEQLSIDHQCEAGELRVVRQRPSIMIIGGASSSCCSDCSVCTATDTASSGAAPRFAAGCGSMSGIAIEISDLGVPICIGFSLCDAIGEAAMVKG